MRSDPLLRHAADQVVSQFGAHIIDLVQRGERGGQVIEVFLDTETGVTVEVCTGVSRALLAQIDAGALVEGKYRLDVSSPGIDRPLVYPWQYTKHIGRKFRLTVKTAEGTGERRGSLTAADAEGIVVQTADGEHRFAFGDIVEARVVAPW
jgi:ribosome maturation factor RimP